MNLFQVLLVATPCFLSWLFWRLLFKQYGGWGIALSVVLGLGTFIIFNVIMIRIFPGKEKAD